MGGRDWGRSRLSGAVTTAAVVLLYGLTVVASAAAYPPYVGAMNFPTINEPSDPEDFSWEVQLGEEEELRAIDDQNAAVYYTEPEHLAFTIAAQSAHDVDGTAVPTTLAVSEGNVITLTVHHRAGNPAAGGTPFDYPILAGAGWEGGFQSHEIAGPATGSGSPATEPATLASPPSYCRVPYLWGESLRASRRLLRHAHCQLGEVRGGRSRRARVVKQFRRPGKILPAGTEVGVKVASG